MDPSFLRPSQLSVVGRLFASPLHSLCTVFPATICTFQPLSELPLPTTSAKSIVECRMSPRGERPVCSVMIEFAGGISFVV
jgi:hypothetical protein